MRIVRANHRRRSSGQGLAEFALTIPILFLLAVAVGDFGRIYLSLIAVEDSAREAADYAAFDSRGTNFDTAPLGPCPAPWGANSTICPTQTAVDEMLRRACAAVSGLPEFDPATTCSDPTFFDYDLEDHSGDAPWATTCGTGPQPDATCGWIVHVTVTFDFHTTIQGFPPFPDTVTIVRESRFAVSTLGVPGG